MSESLIWKFSNPLSRSACGATFSSRNADSLLMSSQTQSGNGLADPIAKSIGQHFWVSFSEELQRRGLIAVRVTMRTFICAEKLRSSRSRTRVEIDAVIEAPLASQNELIEALVAAKRTCSRWFGPNVKVLLKAELRTEHTFELTSLAKSARR
jgi:hypothetical protein